MIDYVITNVDNVNVKVLLDDKISDHSAITFEVKNKVIQKVTKLCGYKREAFIDKLTKVELSKSIGMTVDEKADFLTDNLKTCLKDFVKLVTTKQNDKEWYTPSLRQQRRDTGDAYKKAYYTDDPFDWMEYKRVSKLYTLNIKT